MPKSIYKTETAAISGVLLDDLLTNFPMPVSFHEHELALRLGFTVERIDNEVFGTTYKISDLPSGLTILNLTNNIIIFLRQEGYVSFGEDPLKDVVLSGKGLRAMEEHPDFVIESLLDRGTKQAVSPSAARSGS
ncbi:hypothetical protein [Methylobacterium flocculans]|uniref:hypothetical protein n=1 Tax=Methylobacterium flocculans TaxID=2984843 RepID=UPI0021F32F68|nr:hypothetical protein [Methylobacterium sp. FF17]